jgi:hypothetical protein
VDIDGVLLPYGRHDVKETKKFAHISLDPIKFRIELQDILDGDVLNWSDSKIGSKILEQRLGDELCYTRESGRREARKTRRDRIALADIIFPFVRFSHPEFARILTWMRAQTITEDEVTGKLKTKGVFSDVHATVGGLDFHFGMGGIHACVAPQVVRADAETMIRDIDVAGLYPAIAIVNRLYPEHLGERFVFEYAQLPIERAKYKKGHAALERVQARRERHLWQQQQRIFDFLRPQVHHGDHDQRPDVVCMLAEWLLSVPTVRLSAGEHGRHHLHDPARHVAAAQEDRGRLGKPIRAWSLRTSNIRRCGSATSTTTLLNRRRETETQGSVLVSGQFPRRHQQREPAGLAQGFVGADRHQSRGRAHDHGRGYRAGDARVRRPVLFMLRQKVDRSCNCSSATRDATDFALLHGARRCAAAKGDAAERTGGALQAQRTASRTTSIIRCCRRCRPTRTTRGSTRRTSRDMRARAGFAGGVPGRGLLPRVGLRLESGQL